MRSTTPSQQDRISQIRGEFLEIVKQENSVFTLEGLQEYLSFKSGKLFPERMLKDIYDSLSVPISSTITTEEFVSGYYSVETRMKSQIDMLKKLVKDESIKLTNTKRQFIEAKANRIPEDNNVLTVIIRKTDIKSTKNLIARLICDDWEVTSNPVQGSSASWDEAFNFNPLSHRNLIIELWEAEKTKLLSCLGKAEIVLNTLKDEELHEDWLKISSPVGTIGKIFVSSQWIQVKVDYLERVVKALEKNLAEKRKEFDELEKDYEEFLSPFIVAAPQWFMQSPRFKKAELELSRQLDDLAVKAFGKEVRWPVALKISIYLYLILSAIVMLYRPDFFNVIAK